MIIKNYSRQILTLNDVELEQFVREWVGSKTATYLEVTRFSGAGDLGRDIVGFKSQKKHEGEWHNFQCKQYNKSLPTDVGICEIGKILYYAFKKEFSAPAKYFFVAPKGINRNLEKLIFNPEQFKYTLINEWEKFCASKIIDGTNIYLDDDLKKFISSFDFSNISRINIDDILNDASVTPVLYKWFGVDPGPAPSGNVPVDVLESELPYVNQLVNAYSQRQNKSFLHHGEISDYPEFCNHLSMQRERFYHADAFKRFYRDNTAQSIVENLESDIFYGVIDKCNSTHIDALARVDEVMSQAATIHPSGILAQHARVPIKQGICHHFANNGKLIWKK